MPAAARSAAAFAAAACCRSISLWLVLATLLVSGSGCDASPQKLLTPTQEALSAVNSAVLALDLFSDHRATAALTKVAVDDATDQLATDQQTVVTLSSSTARQRNDRNAATTAIHRAATAAVDARDALASSTSPQQAHDQLRAAASELTGLIARLQAGP